MDKPNSPVKPSVSKTSPPRMYSRDESGLLDLTDSPSFPMIRINCQMEPGISPMSELARNLYSTNINVNPRKLSMSSISGDEASPLPIRCSSQFVEKFDSPMKISPLVDTNSRLLKNSLRVSTPSGRRGVARRLSELSRDLKDGRNENFPPSSITSSPNKTLTSPSKFAAVRQILRSRTTMEDHDANSQDSGISEDSNKSGFRFAEPSGMAPRKHSTNDFSPKRFSTNNSNSSQCSLESIDDGFMEILHQDKMMEDENAQLPSGMASLLTQPILRNENTLPVHKIETHQVSAHRPTTTFRRCLSENITTKVSNVEEFSLKMKRPAPRQPDSPHSKRPRPLTENNNTPQRKPGQRTLFDHGFMKKTITPKVIASEAIIENALHRSTTEELIGDFTRPYALPLMQVRSHTDLKNITSDTLADLVRGKFDDTIASYQIIDCRYPYEFEGGHIRGAKNIYTKDLLEKEFIESRPALKPSSDKRNVIIFHCEFSSARGPNLSRFLRKRDRNSNSDSYPALNYPELYLLNGGYKAFYSSYSELCEPCSYLTMSDPNYGEDLKHFRSKAKSWSGDRKFGKFTKRPSFMRLT